jgi:hypothetical protein
VGSASWLLVRYGGEGGGRVGEVWHNEAVVAVLLTQARRMSAWLEVEGGQGVWPIVACFPC